MPNIKSAGVTTFDKVRARLEGYKAKCEDHYAPLELIDYRASEGGDSFRLLNKELGFTNRGLRQFCRHMGIQGDFFASCNEENRNGLFRQFHPQSVEKSPGSEVFVRAHDGRVRGVLSSGYGVFDDLRLFNMIERIIGKTKVEESTITNFSHGDEGKMHLSVVWKEQVDLGTSDKPDVYNRGINVSNSEIGDGSVRIEPLLFRQVCTNGMIKQIDSQAVIMRHYGDPVKLEKKIGGFIWNLEKFYQQMFAKITKARDEIVTQMEIEKLISETAKAFNVSNRTDEVIKAFHKEPGNTVLSVANAFTRAAHESFEGDTRYELETVGNLVIDSDIGQLMRNIEAEMARRDGMKTERADIKAWSNEFAAA